MQAAQPASAAQLCQPLSNADSMQPSRLTPGAGSPSPAPGWQRQPPQSLEMRINPSWRRSACDRCRTQKLRCVRAKENDTSRPCTRCLRIRCPCFTSSAKPPGRGSGRLPPAPAQSASSTEVGSDAAPPANTSTSDRRKATVTRRRASGDVSLEPEQTSPVSMGMGMGWPFNQDEDQNEEAGVFDDGGMFMLTPSEQYQPIDFFDFLVDKGSSGFDSVASVPLDVHMRPRAASLSRFRPVTQALPPLPTFNSTLSPSEFHFQGERDDEPESAVDISVDEDQACMPSQTPNPAVQHSPGVLLARLLESLSVQLVRLNTEPWDLGVLSVTGSIANSGELNLLEAEALANDEHTFNPLFSILVSTENLLDICKMFMAPESSGGSDEASTATSVAAGSASRSGSKRRVLSMHEANESRSIQSAAKRTWRPNSAISSLPFPFSPPCSSSSSSSGSNRRKSWPTSSSVPGMPTGQTTITAAQLLTVVSCYLQVVTIYNDIFSHLLFKLALPPPSPSPSTQPLGTNNTGPIPAGINVTPTSRQQRHSHNHYTQQAQSATHGRAPMVHRLVLAGYSVLLNSGLRMRLLVEVVEHQFEQIERALGLPGQYCVSASHHQQAQQQHRDIGGGGQGLLAGREVATLLEAVMEGADADGNANAGRDSMGVVASLRESLGKAQRVRSRGD
ncbi:hypothetical protein QC764_000180 [Podospora pseudoanserina]|uniref:Zn(2)-C6 fungal-type domain-containing protein n=1 Tax=Podospora pseudoanserina TaxID=2609844 RepID=A0ABR0I515_9PEZI|nr:hypothetical protein QC764_000180 [Podospora pseudoanserina]